MASKGKIGVLTFHRCFNYGSYWQARCLVEGLRARGHEAELLDHDCARVSRAEARCLIQPTLPARSRPADTALYKAKGRRFAEAIARLPLSRRFALDGAGGAGGYDAIVIGSDEVWNFSHPWYGGRPLFFGDGLGGARLVAYAASFGNHEAAHGMSGDWAARLGGFSAIAVRDANSARLIEAATGSAPPLVLDPCLQFPEHVAADADREAAPYALIYGHGFPGWLAAAARRWSADAGVRLVSVGYRNDWADEQRLGAGPIEFAAAAAGARAVLTNFFHGCVFALVNGKPFATAPSDYRSTKVRDLAAALGAEDRLVDAATPVEAFAALLATAPGPDVRARIEALRATSSDYLDHALA